MGETSDDESAPSPRTVAWDLDAVCERFASAWADADRPPRIEDFLADVSTSERPRLLDRLLALELSIRRRLGEDASPEDYRDRFPTMSGTRGATSNGEGEGEGGADPGPAGAVAGFEILGELGRGGMGVVFEAFDRERQARVALKTLRHIGPAALYAFKKEFRSLAGLYHENLIPLYQLFADDGRWYFSMELIEDAADLLTYVRAVRPPPSTLAETSSGGARTEPADSGDETAPGSSARASPAETTDVGPPGPPTSASTAIVTSTTTLGPDPAPDIGPPADGDSFRLGAPAPPLDQARLREALRQLAEGVYALHRAKKLHRDLKPGNILVRRDGRVVLLDFGLVAELSAAPEPPGPADRGGAAPRDDPVYNSTDRMIAGTLRYMAPEQAAGESLSQACDWYAVGVILFEALTGRPPVAGHGLALLHNKRMFDAPAPSDLVAGVPEDLDRLCVDLLRRDPAARPTGPQVLARLGSAAGRREATGAGVFVGRERHVAALHRALDAVREGGTAFVRVRGRSGSGKSALVERFLAEAAVDPDVQVLSGRCYELESVPYKALDSLVDQLARALAQVPADELAGLLPPGMPALARVFPVLERLDAPGARAAGATSSDLLELRRNAFAALGELLARLGARRPLILVIDDLQWGDADSAAILAGVLTSASPPRMLLLTTNRSEEEGSSPCLRALSDLEPAAPGTRFETLEVDALTPAEARELAGALLAGSGPPGRALADRVADESAGSAYLVYELARQAAAGPDPARPGGLDLDEMLWRRVARLPGPARRILEYVAVAGRPVRLRTARDAAGLTTIPPEVVSSLRADHLLRGTGPNLDDRVEMYHDRVRESILAHLAAADLASRHSDMGDALEAAGDADAETLAAHFLAAGRAARAGEYFEKAADVAVRALAFERAEGYYRRAVELADGPADRARRYEKTVHFLTDLARFRDAYDVGREALAELGVRLPSKFRPLLFAADFAAARLRLLGRRIPSILDGPDLADPRVSTSVRLLAAIGKSSYQIDPRLCVAVTTKIVKLTLRHGNAPGAAIGFMPFGAIFVGTVLGDYKAGYEFGRLAIDLVEKFDADELRAEVNFVVGYFGTSWLRPATEAEALWRAAYEAGLRNGDLFHTGCACAGIAMSLHMRGVPLAEVDAEIGRSLDVLRPAQLREPMGLLTAVRRAIRDARGEAGDDLDEGAFRRELESYGSRHFALYYHVCKVQALVMRGRFAEAADEAGRSAALRSEVSGLLHAAEHQFYHAVALAARPPDDRRATARRLREARRIHRRFRRWARLCPQNFEPQERLIAAEIERAAGSPRAALAAYGEAASAARRHGRTHVAALALARSAGLHAEAGRRAEAARDAESARDGFAAWGAAAFADAPLGPGTPLGSGLP